MTCRDFFSPARSRHAPRLETVVTADLGQKLGQCRVAPLAWGGGPAKRGLVAVYGADFDVDPFYEMFYFPRDTLKLAVVTLEGDLAWRRDLGPSVVPGMWFCPVLPFDLDGDGVDEVFFVNNRDPDHPLAISRYCLEQLDPVTGRTTGQWPWPIDDQYVQSLSHAFRLFLVGGHVRGEPVLVLASGTYGSMHLRAFDPGMKPRWEVHIPADAPGARGCHMCPVVDIDGDGNDELIWGERCLSLDDGRELFCADRDAYRGHSDVAQPVLDETTGRWRLYTCREKDPDASPRVVCFDDRGERVWGAVEQGHMDIGWVAKIGPSGQQIAVAIQIDHKTCGPGGRMHEGRREFAFDAATGRPVELGFDVYGCLPVDINGDSLHELVRSHANGGTELLDAGGRSLQQLDGRVALVGKMTGHGGEQVVTFDAEGTLKLWADPGAEDSPTARARYARSAYAANLQLGAVGYNLTTLAGF